MRKIYNVRSIQIIEEVYSLDLSQVIDLRKAVLEDGD